jgi:hypothetical protein
VKILVETTIRDKKIRTQGIGFTSVHY